MAEYFLKRRAKLVQIFKYYCDFAVKRSFQKWDPKQSFGEPGKCAGCPFPLMVRTSILLVTFAFGSAAEIERNMVAIRPLPFGSPHTPEVGKTSLEVRIFLEVFAIHNHGFATQVDAARAVRLG
jgi:hypothetical protein